MADTPEAKVKKAVKKVLARYGDELYQHWPVPAGYGRQTLDCIVCFRRRFIAIETKAPGQDFTGPQETVADEMLGAHAIVLLIDEATPERLAPLVALLDKLAAIPAPRPGRVIRADVDA